MVTKSRSLSPSELKGSQEPTHLIVPEYITSEWEDCHAVAKAGGMELMEWQGLILQGWLGRNSLKRWTATTCGGSIPRQNGKTIGLVVPRIGYGMVMLGEEVIYTSHLQKTSTETFEAIAAFFDTRALRKYVKDVKTALGREQVILKNGARVKFLARTRNGGRGQHGDLLVFDEALELDADSQASFLPAISASKNPQAIYISTPPTSRSDGAPFRGIREHCLGGESERSAWFEWSVDEIGDVRDKKRWYEANPSLGHLIQESTVEAECEQMDADTFARERLGWWSPVRSAQYCIDAEEWGECKVDKPSKDGIVCYAVKFSPDGATGVIAACHKGEVPFVYVVDAQSTAHGISWFAEELAEHADKAAQIVIDGQANAQALTDRLLDAGVSRKTIIRPKTGDAIAAYSTFANAVREKSLCHFGQPALDASVTGSERRAIGHYGGWGFQSTETADATLVEAAALAYWAAMTTKRNPERKGRAGC
ncbi:MAG: hypothetical protein IJ113_02340 [Eggerthellaceae bacterium]|nr:hypothetical protein [Eggerthellaceae bacterium]